LLLTIASILVLPASPSAAVGGRCGAAGTALIARSTPKERGPLRLRRIDCLELPHGRFSGSPPRPPPDGRQYYTYDGISGLWVGTTDADAGPMNLTGSLAVEGIGYSGIPAFAWSGQSGLFGVRQATVKPSGFGLQPPEPIWISASGKIAALPPLTNSARRLDGLLWVGGSGLAVAEFDTRGGYYRPERNDPNPSLAIVDGRRGKVLQTVKVTLLLGRRHVRDLDTRVSDIDAQIDNGIVHALFRMGADTWFDWRQGSPPVRAGLRFATVPGRFALAPGGRNVLVMNGLSASGVICERNPACPAPTPAKGPIAQLRDIRTGAVHWTLSGTAATFSNYQRPSISPDGRYALITLPPRADGHASIALVSMADGRVLQRVEPPSPGGYAMGFDDDGDRAWTSGGAVLVTYALAEAKVRPIRRASRTPESRARRIRG
jgi:hypothetical protein